MAHNPECGLDCVSAGAVRLDNPASPNQQTGRQHLSGDQSAEQAKHTPGPWSVDPRSLHVSAEDEKGYMRIADVRGWGHLTGKGIGGWAYSDDMAIGIQEANARLIAAAPEMYEALKAIGARSVVDVYDDEAELRRQLFHINSIANAALAKAEGRDR
jgi:hypothetical protein